MRKLALLTITILALAGTATAGSNLTITAPNHTTIKPGTTQPLGNYTLTVQNTTAALTGIDIFQLPFNVSFSPTQTVVNASCTTTTTNNTTVTDCPPTHSQHTATVTIPPDTDPGNYTGEAVFLFANRSSRQAPVRFTVPTHRRWTVPHTEVRRNLSVDSSGQFTNLTVDNQGNVRQAFNVTVTGKLSPYLSLPSHVSAFAADDTTVKIGYDLPADVPFGWYTANVSVSAGNETESVRLAARVVDELPPQVMDYEVPSVPATRTVQLTLLTQDNQAVVDGNVTVTRPVTQDVNGTTVQLQEPAATLQLEQDGSSNRWTAAFSETTTPGLHFAHFRVRDGANNTARESVEFRVTELDAVEVLSSTFAFNETGPGTATRQPLLAIDKATPVTLRLTAFSHTERNATPWIGVAPSGGEVSTKFEGQGSTITLEDAGEYDLVVESTHAEKLTGEIAVMPVPQHTTVPNVTFEAVFKQVPYPSPRQLWIGGFNGSIGYSADNVSQGDWIVYSGRLPKERCRGAERWSDCGVSDISLGEIDKIRQELRDERRQRQEEQREKRYILVGAVLFVGLLVRKAQIKDRWVAYHGLPMKHYERGLLRSRREFEAAKNERSLKKKLLGLAR